MNWEDGWRSLRSIPIFSDIDQNMSSGVIQQICGLAVAGKEPILLWLNTNGGHVHQALAIVQVMRTCPVPVYTIALGRCFSSGVIISIAGKKRYAFPGTQFMVHEFHTIDNNGPYTTVKARHQAEDWLYSFLTTHFTKYTKIKYPNRVQSIFLGDEYYFDENDALKMGVIDEVLTKPLFFEGDL